MEQIDITIIGAGVVGLAIASEVAKSGREVYIVEKNPTFGMETSGRNSGVIHAGIYNDKDTLKARLCVEGKERMYSTCEQYDIPYKKIGKLIVAVDKSEVSVLEELIKKGNENEVLDLRMLEKREIAKIEPNINAVAAIYSPSTGIVSAYHLMRHFVSKLTANAGGIKPILYNQEVIKIEKKSCGYLVVTKDQKNEEQAFLTKILINSAGLFSDKIAEIAGINIINAGYILQYWKGEYFRVGSKHEGKIKRLIYPIPEINGVGAHATLDIDNGIKIGPNAVYMPKNIIDYSVDESHREEMFNSVRKFLQFLGAEDLYPDQVGIRPRLLQGEKAKKDFIIKEESGRGLPGLINLIGIESPGLTASPAIGRYVARIADNLLV